MGNGLGKIGVCFTGGGYNSYKTRHQRGHHHHQGGLNMYVSDPCDEGLGHSFCYVPPIDPTRTITNSNSSDVVTDESPAALFRAISGASVSANTSTSLSTSFLDSSAGPVSSAFESSTSFASIPLQPLPRGTGLSGPLSGPVERGFMSGPIERGFMSGPLDSAAGGSVFSGPLEKGYFGNYSSFRRSMSQHSGWAAAPALIRGLRRTISKKLSRGQSSIVAPMKGVGPVKCQDSWIVGGCEKIRENSGVNNSSEGSCTLDDRDSLEGGGGGGGHGNNNSQNLQWAQGRAGEDRVHVVISEEHGWVFVGIYDGFSGPDATDFLLSNLYSSVIKELKGLLWEEDKPESQSLTSSSSVSNTSSVSSESSSSNSSSSTSSTEADGSSSSSVHRINNCETNNNNNNSSNNLRGCAHCLEQDSYPSISGQSDTDSTTISNVKSPRNSNHNSTNNKYSTTARKWRSEWDKERVELDRRLKEQLSKKGQEGSTKSINHSEVLKALSQALKMTEEAYFDVADKLLGENPELALMGSCVLVMLMKGEDVYVMNVGDSRAVLAQKTEPDLRLGKIDQDLEMINEESLYDFEAPDGVRSTLSAFQLTVDHSTSEEEEVQRIRNEHSDDPCAISNDRVKGTLKVTRAFGAGFLKQRKWNEALLEMFRIDYVGTSPYINCTPSLWHHRLGLKDRFLILSSDGLYQYMTNEEAVAEVELFISLSPEGDPAQHLVEEVLFRAARKAGLDFYDLLEIPQGERRRYHDDVSIIVISFEGRIWRSSV